MTAAIKPALRRRVAAELIGTAFLLTAVVGSGIAAQRLSPNDVGPVAWRGGSDRRPWLLIIALGRTGRLQLIGWAVGAYIAAAYWFTSSTSFANPAVTIARMFSDTFAGIEPASVPMFLLAQAVGGAAGYGLSRAIHGRPILTAVTQENSNELQPADNRDSRR
jgi:glycerol uptake facilitator-like aquaporin